MQILTQIVQKLYTYLETNLTENISEYSVLIEWTSLYQSQSKK